VRRLVVIGFFIVISIMMVSCKSSNNERLDISLEGDLSAEEDGSAQTLRVELVSTLVVNANHALGNRIRKFDAEHANIQIEYISSNSDYADISPWALGLESRGTPPDMIEITYNQMLDMYHHGKIEPLNINETDLQDLVLTAPDGAVIGLKTKVSPLIVYYNEEIFDRMGLEEPSGDWDWAMLDNTIEALKTAGHNVHIMLSPFTLEWLTMSRYGGRITDPHNMTFGGYLDGQAAVQAAEWFAWVGTKKEDFTVPNNSNFTMPHALINGEAALAIDSAYRVNHYHYESILERNDQIKIAPLPGASDTINTAQVTGFSILSSSPNKDAAMKLLRYLAEDREDYVHDIAMYSMQARQMGGHMIDEINPDRYAIIVQEIQRSVPASLFMSESYNHGMNFNSEYVYPLLREIIDGRSAGDALEQYAQQLDVLISTFREDPKAYGQCIRNGRAECAF